MHDGTSYETPAEIAMLRRLGTLLVCQQCLRL